MRQKMICRCEMDTDCESYRRVMQVMSKRMLCASYYAVCPRCGCSLERDYMAFCDRCGQHLGWSEYKKARVIDT